VCASVNSITIMQLIHYMQTLALVGNDFDDSKAALLLEASLTSSASAITIDVPTAPLRPTAIALKDLEAIEYYPFQSSR
jgi:hypothetical protein